jgi:hypothetical protein
MTGDACYYGHWNSNLPLSLGWVTNPILSHHLEQPSLKDLEDRRSTKLVRLGIPSWSSASVTIQVFFLRSCDQSDVTIHLCDWKVDDQSGILSVCAYCAAVPYIAVPRDDDEKKCFNPFYEYNLQDVSMFYFPKFHQSPLVQVMKWRQNSESDNYDAIGLALLDEPETTSDGIYTVLLFTIRGRMVVLLVRAMRDEGLKSNCFRRVGAGLVATRALFFVQRT